MIQNFKTIQIDYHRNGVSGEGFHVVHFSADVDSKHGIFMAIVFDPDEGMSYADAKDTFHNPRVAVFNTLKLPNTRFMENSWRGDNFAPFIYEALAESERKHREKIEADLRGVRA